MDDKMHNPKAIKGISKDLRGMSMRSALTALLNVWNYATAPYIFRTDEEHTRCRKVAKAIDARLRNMGVYGQWREFDSGYRWPIS